MTRKELSQLYYLNREIELDKKRLEELTEAATGVNCRITGMPFSKGIGDKVGNYASEIADLKNMIELNIQRCWSQLIKLNEYIQKIDDSLIRQILILRYIKGLTWCQVAQRIGGNNTENNVEKIHSRFLKKVESSSHMSR